MTKGGSFSNRFRKAEDYKAVVKELHVKIARLTVTRPIHAGCSDVTFILVRHGFLYLVAIKDWATRKVFS